MLKILKFIMTVIFVLTTTCVWAKSTLVLDMRNAPQLPKNFRTTSDTLPASINTSGLSDLFIAGGGQFSKASLERILSRLRVKNMVVIDLRQESHGMLNGNAVSWYARRNAENSGKTPVEIEKDQSMLLTQLAEEEIAVVDNVLKKSTDGAIERVKPIEYVVHQTNTEEEFVTEKNLKYKRIYVQDYHAPSDKEVDRFIEMVRSLPKEKWIYFHCRAGVGRTTVFLTMYDMLHNAKKVSFEDIIKRQIALGGKDLRALPDKHSFKYQAAVERRKFIEKFYAYARENRDDYKTIWSQWVREGI